ncbi:MAG: PH domain-containing protein [Streptosporangiaceae bacterium]
MRKEDLLAEGEWSVLLLHPHWKTVVRPVLLLILVLAAIGALLFFHRHVPPPAFLGSGALAVVVLLAGVAIPVLRWRTTTYELTTRRLRLRRGILSRTGRDFPLIRISDVSFSHGLIDRLLGCGQLIVESAGEHGQLVLAEIPHVEMVQATLFQLVEDEQQRLSREEH